VLTIAFHRGSETAIFSGMSAILKDEEFVAVEAAVKAGVAPQPVLRPCGRKSQV